jgi:hypothetical protein
MWELPSSDSYFYSSGENIMSETIIKAIDDAGAHTVDVIERNSLSQSAQAERLGLETMNKVDADTSDVDKTVQRFGFANLDATRGEGAEGRDTTEQFGFQELNSIERHGDAAVAQTVASAADTRSEVERFGFKNIQGSEAARAASETYGYRGVVATKDAEKEVLEAICASSAGLSAAAREILLQVAGGTKDVLMHAAQDTAALQMSMCADTKEILLQAASDTASIKSQSASEFKDGLLQAASIAQAQAVDSAKNAAAVALQNALNAKDAEITAVGFAKDAALAAAVNYEKLFGQADRNTAALQASIAECCCENKSLIRETSGHTDALIRALDEGRVKEELLAARFKILALENKIPHVAVAA